MALEIDIQYQAKASSTNLNRRFSDLTGGACVLESFVFAKGVADGKIKKTSTKGVAITTNGARISDDVEVEISGTLVSGDVNKRIGIYLQYEHTNTTSPVNYIFVVGNTNNVGVPTPSTGMEFILLGEFAIPDLTNSTYNFTPAPIGFVKLNVTGNSTMKNLTVNGPLTINGSLAINDDVTLSQGLTVSGSAPGAGGLEVDDTTGVVSITENVTVATGKTFTNNGSTTLNQTTINGVTEINGTVTVGTTGDNQNLTVNGNATVTGTSTLGETVVGTISSNKNLTVNGKVAEGQQTTARGSFSHAEGGYSNAGSAYAHAEGNRTLAANGTIHTIVGFDTTNKTITVDSTNGIAVGDTLLIKTDSIQSAISVTVSSVSAPNKTIALNQIPNSSWKYAIETAIDPDTQLSAHAEGTATLAFGIGSHSEGYLTHAIANYAHAEGEKTLAGLSSHAEGFMTGAIGGDVFRIVDAEPSTNSVYITTNTTSASLASGHFVYIQTEDEFLQTTIDSAAFQSSGLYVSKTKVAFSDNVTVSLDWKGFCFIRPVTTKKGMHVQNGNTLAVSSYSHAGGYLTVADRTYQTVIGKRNSLTPVGNDRAFVVGNGISSSSHSNAFEVDWDGTIYAQSTAISSASTSEGDYAEMFQWDDDNPDIEDRRGYFVTLNNDKIVIADEKSDYILGVVSSTPAVIADSAPKNWQGKYVKDELQSIVYDEFEDADGILRKVPRVSEAYNETELYIPREKRPEWSPIGMLGKLYVRDDGTCEVGKYCKPNQDGVATKSDSGYRVINRVNENIVRIIFR